VQVLTLPLPIYVDDCTLIGPDRCKVDAEMDALHEWCGAVCGVFFKVIKDRLAAPVQLALGFWWDSRTLTRELEKGKLVSYMELLADYATRDKLTLREMQSVAGRMQRCIMTFPPGAACLLVGVFALSVGLKLPWHARRLTRRVRGDLAFVHRLLGLNLGRGFYSFANFKRAPPVATDASKSKAYTGGGFVNGCGRYSFWRYGTRAARKLIDFLEGDTVVATVRLLAHLWRGCIVPFLIDNQAFQRSGVAVRSRAQRLNELLRELFILQIECFILEYFWISTTDNINADDLSRDREAEFLVHVRETGFWSDETEAIRLEGAGETRVLPEKRGVLPRNFEPPPPPEPPSRPSTLNADAPAFSPYKAVAGLETDAASYVRRAQAAAGVRVAGGARRPSTLMLLVMLFGGCCVPTVEAMPGGSIQTSVPYSRASIWEGLPAAVAGTL